MIIFLYIVAIVFGLLIGNFATSIFYRLPQGITICGMQGKDHKPPFCSYCHHPLKFYEYLPLLSWISTFGRCNYCGHSVAVQYFILEIGAVIIACGCLYLLGGINDLYILLFGFSISCLLSILIYRQHKFVPEIILISMVFLGAIYRTLIEATIMEWLSAVSLALIIALFLQRTNNLKNHVVGSSALVAVWCPQNDLVLYGLMILALSILWKIWQEFDLYSASIIALLTIVWSNVILIHNLRSIS